MNENLRKFGLYAMNTFSYWQSTTGFNQTIDSRIGYYPLSIFPRILQSHYLYFDQDGIPTFPNKNGIMVHHYTTLCSYALGRWEQYLQTGDEKSAFHLIKTAEYLAKSFVDSNGVALFLDFENKDENTGSPCAMNQGEAISVLIRGFEITQDSKYLEIAKAASKAFVLEYGNGGVAKQVPGLDVIWYLEGGKIILNGHNYALWGLRELAAFTQDHQIKTLYDMGINSLEKALPSFDNGYWSWYWLENPPYIASMMYHNLHIVQLYDLAIGAGSETITNFSLSFQKYASNPLNRIKSLSKLIKAKV